MSLAPLAPATIVRRIATVVHPLMVLFRIRQDCLMRTYIDMEADAGAAHVIRRISRFLGYLCCTLLGDRNGFDLCKVDYVCKQLEPMVTIQSVAIFY